AGGQQQADRRVVIQRNEPERAFLVSDRGAQAVAGAGGDEVGAVGSGEGGHADGAVQQALIGGDKRLELRRAAETGDQFGQVGGRSRSRSRAGRRVFR